MKTIIKLIFSCVIISLLIVGCSKNNNQARTSRLNGKIKRIQETLVISNNTRYYDLYFYYDSTDGLLQKVTIGNKVFVEISKKTNNYFILDYDASLRDSTNITPNHTKIKAYIDNNGYINRLVHIDSTLTQEQEFMNIYTTNGLPDSILQYTVGQPKYYNFSFLNGNIDELVNSFYVSNLGNISTHEKYYYSNKINNNLVPFQYNNQYSYFIGFATGATEPLYLLGLNGYYPFTPNDNLMDSIKTVNVNTVAMYNYNTNSLGQINKMDIFKDISTISNFDIEYY